MELNGSQTLDRTWAIMINHFHAAVETPLPKLVRGMQWYGHTSACITWPTTMERSAASRRTRLRPTLDPSCLRVR